MSAAAVAAGLQAGASVQNALTSLGGLIYNIYANKQAREDQFYFYNDQKNWQSPSNQMLLRRAAGLNPYGDFTVGSVGQPTPVNLASGVNESISNINSSLSKGAEGYLNVLAYRINKKRMQLEEKRLDKDIEAIDAKNRLVDEQTFYQQLMNYIADNTKDSKVQYSYSEMEDMVNRAFSSGIEADWKDEMLELEYEKFWHEIRSMEKHQKYEDRKLAAETETMEEALKQMQQKNYGFDTFKRLFKDAGIDPNSNFGTMILFLMFLYLNK